MVNPPNNYPIPFYIGTTPYQDLVKANMDLNMEFIPRMKSNSYSPRVVNPPNNYPIPFILVLHPIRI